MKRRKKPPEVVVVTGASAGVGRATVRAFARRGARLGLIARGRDGLEATRREVEELGGRALVLPLDVARADLVELAAAQVEEELGPIDVWINNAMASVFSPARETTAEEYRRVAEVTYLGTVHGTLAALRRMLPRDRGSIVQVGSALAYRGIPLQSAYCAAKHHGRREVYVGWPTVKAIVGNKLVPGFADRYLARKGYESQQYDGLADPHRPHNLWEPVPGDPGAHGSFDERATDRSPQLWLTIHRGLLALLGGGLVGALLAYRPRLGRSHHRAGHF